MKKRKGFLPARTIGKRIAVRFADHSLYSKEDFQCEVMGVVEKWSEKDVVIRWWSCFESGDAVPVIEDANNEICRIIQGTIIKWALCEPKKWNEVA